MTAAVCPDCEGTGIYGATRAEVDAGKYHGKNMALCRHLRIEGDAVDHPSHYNIVPGIECIDVVEHFSFNRGNAIKYLWRAGAKGDAVEDLRKAIWYIKREIAGLEAASPPAALQATRPTDEHGDPVPLRPSPTHPAPPTRPSSTTRGH